MARLTSPPTVRIVYHREGFESPIGHLVRNRMEATVCDWLVKHGIAHRHASEVFAVKTGAARVPNIYVPDIILHDRNPQGKTIIVEPIHTYAPKDGGSRLLASFRKELKSKYYVIVIAKKHYLHKVQKGAYDVLIDFDNLDLLLKKIPLFPR
ncbi:MAG TPA: hypothetical protein VFG32_12855 [Bacteroidota bacterium]|nr:hypothetical protein [Bacteroidota bacterium]